MTKVEPNQTAVVSGDDPTIADCSEVVRIERQPNRTRIIVSDVEGHVLNVIVKPIRRSKATTPHAAARFFRGSEGRIFQANDRFGGTLSLKKIHSSGVFAFSIFLRPVQCTGNQIRSVRKVEYLVLPHDIRQSSLQNIGVVCRPVAFCVIR